MLVIRMQRTGRKGHAQFRVVVQDSRRTPSSGKVVAQVGTYDPHSKQTVIDKDKAQHYLDHGAQPSPRVISILKSEGVSLPKWVATGDKKSSAIRHPEKLRRNQPKEAVVPEEPTAEVTAEESPAEPVETAPAATEETPVKA